MQPAKLSLIAVAIIFSSVSLFAQSDSVNLNSQIQFHLVNGYSVSYLNFYSKQSALRLKLDLGFSFDDNSGDEKLIPGFDSRLPEVIYSNKNKNNSQLILIQAAYLNYPYKLSGFRLFWGAGPFLSFKRNFHQTTAEHDIMQGSAVVRATQLYENEYYTFNLGIVSTVGVECSISKRISMIGEYNFYVSREWIKEKNKNNQSAAQPISSYQNEISTTGWNLSLSNIKLGIAYRF